MRQATPTQNNHEMVRLLGRVVSARKKIPESWTKAAGLIRNAKQKRALERHVTQIRSEWK